MADTSKRYTAAVIGVGRAGPGTYAKGGGHQIGYTHAQAFGRSPRAALVCGADVNRANLDAFNAKFGLAHAGFTDHRAMLREARPDVVSIGTYVGLHRAMIEDCARAGVKGILCEKPFLASPADVAAVRRVADETGVRIVVAHIRRYLPAFERARDLYTGGAVGEPVLCLAGIGGWDLSEWGSHWLDMFRYFHNDRPVEWVMGQARVRDTRGYGHAMEEHAVAYFGFRGGGKGLLDGGTGMTANANMTLVGTAGTIRIYDERRVEVDTADGRTVEDFGDKPPVGWDRTNVRADASWWLYPWDMTVHELVGWMEGGPVPRVGLPTMLETAELNLAAYLSAVRGDRVDLPLDDPSTEWPVEVLARRATARPGGGGA